MTVSTTTSSVSYSANGTQTTFDYTFKIFTESDLVVVVKNDSTGVETTQVLTTDYTVTGAGSETGGSVAFVSAPANGTTVFIQRSLPLTQTTDYVENDPFPAEAHEEALDRLTMISQQINADIVSSIRVPERTGVTTLTPNAATRAGKLIGFSATGSVDLSDSTIAQVDAAVSSFVNATGNNASSILYDPDGTGADQRSVESRLRETISVKDFGATGDGTTDDTTAIQDADAAAEAANAILVFPRGTYYFTSDLTFDASVRMEGGVLLGSNTVSFPTNFDADGYYCFRCPTLTVRTFKVNVKWYGARGDGTGDTPGDESIDITSEPWNTWDGTGWKDNVSWSPYGTSGSFVAPRPSGLPFANDDTWDYIGCSRALWAGENNRQTTFFPAGKFIINVSSTDSKGGLNGLSIMRDMNQTIEGAGTYETFITTKEDANFFNTTSTGSTNAFQLFNIYRTGGAPTHIKSIAFIGPTNYTVTSQNLTLIRCQNINGVTFRELWLAAGDYGIHSIVNGGDSHIKGCSSEFLWGATVFTDSSCDFTIDFCNFWASAVTTGQKGIEAEGKVDVRNTRFIQFEGQACLAASGVFQNNYVASSSAGRAIHFTDGDALITGNYIVGASASSMVKVEKDSTISNNYFEQTDVHACVDVGDGTASSATNVVIIGNTFIKTNSASGAQNYAITALQDGVSYTGAATASMFIIGNTFQGRALTSIGSATLKDNIFSGVYTA